MRKDLIILIGIFGFAGGAFGAIKEDLGPEPAEVDTAKHQKFPFEEDEDEASPCKGSIFAYEVRFAPQQVLALDHYVKTWLKDNNSYSLSAEMQLDTYKKYVLNGQHSTTEAYAHDYGYPTFSLGLRYNFNHATTMHRDAEDWGDDLPVDYTTHLGDVLTLYGRFERPIFRTRRWSGGYYIGTGVGYAMSCYDRKRHIDNEFIGTHLNIFFTSGLFLSYYLTKDWAMQVGVDYAHHSNGALYRPNKGANCFGPFVGVKYSPQPDCPTPRRAQAEIADQDDWRRHPWFVELSLGVGAKSLNEDWQNTQFYSQPTDPDYRTEKFSVYGAFSLQTDVMYRYARRWATGLGVDVFYGDYASKTARLSGNAGSSVSPWSVGLAVKHEAFYGRLTARLGVGYYLFRHAGKLAKAVEKRYYERVGLSYNIPHMRGLSVGFSINAHKTKADFTELSLSYPIRL